MINNNGSLYVSKPPKFEGKTRVWVCCLEHQVPVLGRGQWSWRNTESKLWQQATSYKRSLTGWHWSHTGGPRESHPAKCYSYGCYGALYEQNGQLPPRSSKHARRCRFSFQKGMEDMVEHPESLSTHGCNRLKELNNGFAKDQVEERC